MRIGVCGGTFDPFHRGHLDPILAVRSRLQWDRIIYVPAHRQPFKTDRDAASGYHRFTMTVLGTEEHDAVYVSPVELERGAVSYTIDTLDVLSREHPGAELDWVIGDDHMARLPEWREPERIFAMARFIVLNRNAETEVPLALRDRHAAGRIVFAQNDTVAVSSTEIRRRVRAGEPIDDFVHPHVSRYIQRNGLYQGARS